MNIATLELNYPAMLDAEIVTDTIGYIAACIEDLLTEHHIPNTVTNDSTTITVRLSTGDLAGALQIEDFTVYL